MNNSKQKTAKSEIRERLGEMVMELADELARSAIMGTISGLSISVPEPRLRKIVRQVVEDDSLWSNNDEPLVPLPLQSDDEEPSG